jgi:hypothetical protein
MLEEDFPMKKFATVAIIGGLALGLAACGSSDDASTEAMPDTVEMPADEALAPIADEPVEDAGALAPPPASDEPAPYEATTEEAADAAAQVAADAQAAAEAAEAAAAATEN